MARRKQQETIGDQTVKQQEQVLDGAEGTAQVAEEVTEQAAADHLAEETDPDNDASDNADEPDDTI